MSLRIMAVTSYYKPAYVYGGPVRSASALFEALVQENYQVEVFTTNANGTERLDVPLEMPIDVDGVKVRYYQLDKIPLNFRSTTLAAGVSEQIHRFDFVHIEGVWNYNLIVASKACQAANIPYVVVLRGQLLPWSLAQKKLKKRIYLEAYARKHLNRASGLFCTDEVEAEHAAKLGLRAPIIILPNGLKTTKFDQLPPRMKLRERLGIPKSAIVLLFVGRLHHKKRPDIVIDVHANLQKNVTHPLHLIIVGPDEENMLATLRQRINQHGTQNKVHFTGLLKNDAVLDAYAAADIFLMPSEPNSENFGIAAAEAMAAGLPVVTTNTIPAGIWAQKFGAGVTTECSVSAFTEATYVLLENRESLAKMGEMGKLVAKTKFERSVVAKQVIKNYKAIVQKRRNYRI